MYVCLNSLVESLRCYYILPEYFKLTFLRPAELNLLVCIETESDGEHREHADSITVSIVGDRCGTRRVHPTLAWVRKPAPLWRRVHAVPVLIPYVIGSSIVYEFIHT